MLSGTAEWFHGYVKQENLAKNPVGDAGTDNAPGADGGEISVEISGGIALLSTVAPQEGAVSGKAVVLADGEQAEPSWEGVSRQILTVYADYWMLGRPVDRLDANTPVTVLYALENCYLVEVNGVMGYVAKNQVEVLPTAEKNTEETTKPTEATTPPETGKPAEETTPPETTQPAEETIPPETTKPPEWTPPML